MLVNFRTFSPTLFYAGLILFGGAHEAQATRSVSFMASGQNALDPLVINSPSQNDCEITVANASAQPQLITVTINGTVAGSIHSNTDHYTIYQSGASQYDNTTHSGTLTDASRTLAAAGTNGDNVFYTWQPPPIAAGVANTDEIKCYGSIQVQDSTVTLPGFITASGVITTFQEIQPGVTLSTSGGTSKGYTTSPTQSVIVIGEGRPF